MKLPAFLYGTTRDVTRGGRRMVTQLRRGVPWAELAGEMIDTRDVPGLIYIDGPVRHVYGEHFHPWVPARAIEEVAGTKLPLDAFTTLFEPAISTLWGCMALLSSTHEFVLTMEHRKRFLQTLVGYWDEIDAEGERYTKGRFMGERLWALPSTIKYCLVHLGLPKERLYEPLPPGGLRELVNQTAARFDDAADPAADPARS